MPERPDEARRPRAGGRRVVAAARGVRRAEHAGDRAVDGAGGPVPALAVDRARADRSGRAVGGAAVPPGRAGEPAARGRDHGHARLGRHARGVRVVGVRDGARHGGPGRSTPLVRPVGGPDRRRGSGLSGGRGRRHDVRAGRAVPGGEGPPPVRGSAARPARARRHRRTRAARRARAPGPRRPARRRGHLRGAARRADRDGRRGRRGIVRGRHRRDHRRAGAHRRRAGRRRRRRVRRARRAARRARDPRRRRHAARPHRGARRAGAQNGKAAVQRLADRVCGEFVPVVLLLAAATWGFWTGPARPRTTRSRPRRRPDRRLPVRARARHPDRAARRHRTRRAARRARDGPRGARVDPPGRHGRARQDRHGHHRGDERGGRRASRRRGRRRGARDGRGARRDVDTPGVAGRRPPRGRPAGASRARRRRGSTGCGVRGPTTATCCSAGRGCCRSGASTCRTA